jgi:hypothetical protein
MLTLAILFAGLIGSSPPASPEDEQALNAKVESAVTRGLEYLRRTQTQAGCWTGDIGHKQEDAYLVLSSAAYQRQIGAGHVGVSALAGLAFLAGGHVPGRSEYGPVVERTLDYLLRSEKDHGYITEAGSRMYSHAFALLFLTQLYGMQARADFRDKIQRAVELIADCQNEQGGWRYDPFVVEADLSVTVCQLQALRSANDIGVSVPKSTIDRAVAYVRRSRITDGRDTGSYYYKIEGRAARTKTSFAVNAAAVTSLMSSGKYNLSEFEPAVRYIESHYAEISDYYDDHFYFWYGNYYAAQVMFHIGGQRWTRYFNHLRDDLLARQNADGSWPNSVGPGPAFATAVACILLQMPKQALPIFQR